MSWSVPVIDRKGRVIRPEEKPVLADGERCLVCFETDPARFANCTQGDCYPISNYESEKPDTSGFKLAKPFVSAFDLAKRMRAKALRLDWEQDELREQLLTRARALEKGDRAEVPDEDF
jgi:hypothetical protein